MPSWGDGETGTRTVVSVPVVVDKNAFAAVLRNATNGRSVRSLAERTGWGRTTVHDWLTGVRLPSAQQVEDLLGAVGASAPLVLEVQQLRIEVAPSPGPVGRLEQQHASGEPAQASDPAVTAPQGLDLLTPQVEVGAPAGAVGSAAQEDETTSGLTSTTRGRSDRRISRLLLAGIIGLVGVTSFAGGFVAGRAGDVQIPSTISTLSASALPQAHVQGTLGKGLISHRGPDGTTERVGSLYEGQTVSIACISPTGSRIEDDTMHEARSDWALLGDGTWVSVLYLDIHRRWTPPQPPPPPFTVC